MSDDLDPKGLEAAAETMWSRRDFWGTSDLAEELAEACIRAYEAHKAFAVPDDLPLSDPRHPESISSFLPSAVPERVRLVRPNHLIDRPSAVPDEVREVVKDLRAYLALMDERDGEGKVPWMYNVCKRAADLLEQMAGEIERLKDALENAVVTVADHSGAGTAARRP